MKPSSKKKKKEEKDQTLQHPPLVYPQTFPCFPSCRPLEMRQNEWGRREVKAELKHNRSIHPLTSGELSPNNRAFPNALKSTFEDVLVYPWIHLLPTRLLTGLCARLYACIFFLNAAFKFP